MRVLSQAETMTCRNELKKLRAENPRLRIRDAAQHLGIAEMLALQANPAVEVIALKDPGAEILSDAVALGKVMALTRNDFVVHECIGHYAPLQVNEDDVGLVIGDNVDLRLFFRHWKHAFAVISREQGNASLQFFDAAGNALHKIHLRPSSNRKAFTDLVARWRDDDQEPRLPERGTIEPDYLTDVDDDSVDIAAFRRDWDALRDIHDFHAMMRRHRLARQQAFRLAGTKRARPLDPSAVRWLLEYARAHGAPVMVFAGNVGCIQIYSGTIQQLREVGGWFNVLDPHFNLHLKLDGFATCWLVRRPGDHGIVTSVEAFDTDGRSLITFFGLRKPGHAERSDWRSLCAKLEILYARERIAA